LGRGRAGNLTLKFATGKHRVYFTDVYKVIHLLDEQRRA
jgi:hypothetical protein